ncbi:NAD(P)-dependent oxidoreductase [Dactylosporangium sp. NPDC006015]|uniref:NAD(P)-dependent oxidoreductase n=1 Tax=Dactylosporangium sp. NPDC006015 TaxID=3154576 RepID=UPI0033A80D18
MSGATPGAHAEPAIGWIGLGAMGAAMAARLVDRGRPVLGWNRGAARAADAAARGVTVTSDIAEAASRDIVVSMLPDDEVVREVLGGATVLAAVKPGSVHVNCATISPGLSRELDGLYRSRRAHYVSAPAFGRSAAAAGGQLTIVAGGDAEPVGLIRPVLDELAVSVHTFPEPAQANLVKILGNYLIAVTAGSLGEVAGIAERGGLKADQLLDVLTERLFSGLIHRAYGQMVAEQRYEPVAFTMRLGKKDIDLARAEAQHHGGHLPLGDVIAGALGEGVAGTAAEQDWASVAEWFRTRAGGVR